VNINSASSKPAREVNGDQSSSAFVVGTSGAVFGGMDTPCLSQRRPEENENSGISRTLYVPLRFG